MSDSESKKASERKVRRAYKEPTLKKYGNIRDITRAVGDHSHLDNYVASTPHGQKHTALH